MISRRARIVCGLVTGLLLEGPLARAHIALMSPTVRTTELKTAPCGAAGSTRGDNITTFAPGETITVVWQETIGHPGHYRISFDDDGDDDFAEPAGYDDFYSAPSVLVDNITDQSGTQIYMQDVTLPDIECDNCTLQVIQVMTDKPPYGDGNDVYHQCGDLVLARDPGNPGGGDAGGGCSVGSGDTGGSAVLLAFALAVWMARRQRRG